MADGCINAQRMSNVCVRHLPVKQVWAVYKPMPLTTRVPSIGCFRCVALFSISYSTESINERIWFLFMILRLHWMDHDPSGVQCVAKWISSKPLGLMSVVFSRWLEMPLKCQYLTAVILFNFLLMIRDPNNWKYFFISPKIPKCIVRIVIVPMSPCHSPKSVSLPCKFVRDFCGFCRPFQF